MFPGMMGGGDQQRPQHTAKSAKYSEWLKYYTFLTIALGIAQAFTLGFMYMINALMGALILWCARSSMSYCQLLMFVIYNIYPVVGCIGQVGRLFQDYGTWFNTQNRNSSIGICIIGFLTIIISITGIFFENQVF